MATGDRHITIGAYYSEKGTTATESDAVEIFRSVPPERIEAVFASSFASNDSLTDAVLRGGWRTVIGTGYKSEHNLGYRINTDQAAVDRLPDDVGNIIEIIRVLDGNELVRGMPDVFQAVTGSQDSADALIDKAVGFDTGRGTQRPLLFAVVAAFTPMDQRHSLDRNGWCETLRTAEYEQIVENTPDLSGLESAAERLEALIGMLIPPDHATRVARYQEALARLCAEHGITLDALNDSPLAREVHSRAGAAAYVGNLMAVFTDTAGTGHGAVFRARPEVLGREPRTEIRNCVAQPLVGTYFNAVGLLLQHNYQTVLHYIEHVTPTRSTVDDESDGQPLPHPISRWLFGWRRQHS